MQDTQTTLRCPCCGLETDETHLIAVDFAERWTRASELDPDTKEITFVFAGLGDGDGGGFGSTVFYLHESSEFETHAVMLPDGWDEAV